MNHVIAIMVKETIESVGGQIHIETKRGQGTRFILHFNQQRSAMFFE